VVVGRSDQDAARPQAIAVPRLGRLERPVAREDAGEPARRAGGEVDDGEHGRAEVGGEAPDQADERLDAARRRADADEASAAVPCGLTLRAHVSALRG